MPADFRAVVGVPAETLRAIEQAITASETRHAGELRFVVEGAQAPLAVCWLTGWVKT